MSTSLLELQREFQNFILESRDSLGVHVADTGDVNVEERICIYHEAYHLRLTEALSADFGTLLSCIGSQQFSQLARAYIASHPSEHPSIRWFGRALADFCRTHRPWSEMDGVAEVAAFDWAISLSFDAADAEVIDETAMLAIPPKAWCEMCFGFHPSIHTLDLHWNVAAMRGAHDAGEQLPLPEQGETPVRWLVWRQGMQSIYRSMEIDEALTLQLALEGQDFGHLCEAVCEWVDPEDAALHAAGMLRTWIVDGLITEVVLPASEGGD